MVTTIDQAVDLVTAVCRLPGTASFIRDTNRAARALGLREAVAANDTPALFDWLMTSFSFQGISDRIAWDYIQAHGNASWSLIERALDSHRCPCPKLEGFEAYRGCGYRKSAATCSNLADRPTCPVPSLPLRKGDLNQLAFSLFFFLRDHCEGDLVGFIDRLFADVDQSQPADPVAAKAEALIAAFSKVHAVSTKLIAMTFAVLLMTGDPRRPDWGKVGRSLVAIDSLVHNFLHRTGILAAYDRQHPYGNRCHRSDGCAGVIHDLAAWIDASHINRQFPKTFPRLIQFAIWAFCAETRVNICNGRQIDDRLPCTKLDCPVGTTCARLPLRQTPHDQFGHHLELRQPSGRSSLLPYHQGHLDGLCGIYAIINAVRLATADRLALSHDHWTGMFTCLVGEAEKTLNLTGLVATGLGTRQVMKLARYAAELVTAYGIGLTVNRPLLRSPVLPIDGLIEQLRHLLEYPGSAVLIGIGGKLDHWSVLSSVSGHYLNLFDSGGFQRIRIDNCRTSHKRWRQAAAGHVLAPSWVIQIAGANEADNQSAGGCSARFAGGTSSGSVGEPLDGWADAIAVLQEKTLDRRRRCQRAGTNDPASRRELPYVKRWDVFAGAPSNHPR